MLTHSRLQPVTGVGRDAVGGNVLGRCVKAGAMGLAEFLGKDERIICNGQLSWVCVEVVING